jgi:hypothetical protein
MRTLRTIGFHVIALLAVVSLATYGAMMARSATGRAPKTESSVVDAKGNLRVPEDYRTSYQFLGSWASAADSGKGSKEIHSVYASPGAIAAYRKTGHFPDGAVLVKERFQATTQPMKSGTISHAEKLVGWFVMVKESKDIHPENKLWGDGWAWSFFNSDNPVKATSTNYKVDCMPCHTPARTTDYIYVLGYPPLLDAH